MRKATLLVLALLCSGCAEMFLASAAGSGARFVAIDSTPRGAEILQNDVTVGVTPSLVLVDRIGEDSVVLRLDGYHDQTVEGLRAVATDGVHGAVQVRARMTPSESPEPDPIKVEADGGA